MKKLLLGLIYLLSVSITTHANPLPVAWFSHNAEKKVTLNVDLFLSSTCPHCHKADLFFSEIEKKEPWLIVHRYVINQDKLALATFYEHLKQQKESDFAVPAIFFCDSRWTGFADDSTTGKTLLQAMRYCHQKISEQGELRPETVNVLRKQAASTNIRINLSMANSAVLFTPWAAFTDALNPCSLFCMAAFLAFLWLYPLRKWSQLSLGLVFLISLGVIHFVQQVYSLTYYQMIPEWRLWTLFIGAALLFMVFSAYRKKMSQAAASPGLLMLVVMVFTVFAVQTYQQTCALNMSFIFGQWLTKQAYLPSTHLFYQIIYQALYLLPLTLLLLFYFFMGRYRRMCSFHKPLNIAAYLILSSIGIILLVFPTLLANSWASIIVLFGSIVVGWFVERHYAKVN